MGLSDNCVDCYKTMCIIEDIPKVFVDRLKEFMLEHKMSQGKLARRLKMQQASVSKWLRFKTMPETFVLIDLAKIFDCSVDFLLGRDKS